MGAKMISIDQQGGVGSGSLRSAGASAPPDDPTGAQRPAAGSRRFLEALVRCLVAAAFGLILQAASPIGSTAAAAAELISPEELAKLKPELCQSASSQSHCWFEDVSGREIWVALYFGSDDGSDQVLRRKVEDIATEGGAKCSSANEPLAHIECESEDGRLYHRLH